MYYAKEAKFCIFGRLELAYTIFNFHKILIAVTGNMNGREIAVFGLGVVGTGLVVNALNYWSTRNQPGW